MKQSAVQLFLLLCMQKYNKNTKRHEHCATLWLILKGYYKKQWLFSIDGSEVSQDLIQEFSSGSRAPFLHARLEMLLQGKVTRNLRKSVKVLLWQRQEFPMRDNKASDVTLNLCKEESIH